MARRRAADGYSRLVTLLKIGLPLTGAALLGSVADLEAMGTGLKVTNPRFSGASLDGDRYDFEAATVVPRDIAMEMAEVDALTGTIRFADGLAVDLEAPFATVDLTSETLLFDRGLAVRTNSGIEATAGSANMDLRQGVLHADGGIAAEAALGTIVSDRLTIAARTPGGVAALTEGSTLLFTGRVKLRYVPQEND